jgi:hypothetical protein
LASEEKLKKFLVRATQASAKNTRLSLYQVISTGGESLLKNEDLSAEYGYGEERILEMLGAFWEIAQDDADGHLGTTAYVVVAYQGAKMGERSPVFRLRANGDSVIGSGLSETEPANAQGLLAQLMRHNEAKDRQLAIAMEHMANQATSIITRLTTSNEHYEKRHWDNIELAEKMTLERDTAQLDREKQKSFDKRADETIKMLKPIVPLLFSKLKGISKSDKAGAQTDVLKALMSNITPEQMEQIATILGPQSLALAELYLDARKAEFEDEQSSEASKH